MEFSTSAQSGSSKIEKLSNSLYKIGPLGNPKVLCSYILLDDKNCIVDCGPTVAVKELLDSVEEIGVKPDEIDFLFLTHVHVDHAGGTAEFLKRCSNAVAFVPEKGYKHLIDPSLLNPSARSVLGSDILDYWGEVEPVPKERLFSTKAGEKISTGKSTIHYISATGHAPHHCVLYEEKASTIFAADAVGIVDEEFGLVCPTSPPPAFDFDQSLNDIKMVKDLTSSLLCLPHFKTIIPEPSFFMEVNELYENWSRILRNFLESKSEQLTKTDWEEMYAVLESAYPAYRKVSDALKLQIRRVDIVGFAQWFLKQKLIKPQQS